ncbi:hypothetical protein [Spirosoma koreense]
MRSYQKPTVGEVHAGLHRTCREETNVKLAYRTPVDPYPNGGRGMEHGAGKVGERFWLEW